MPALARIAADGVRLPALERIRARGRCKTVPGSALEHPLLSQLFEVTPRPWPFAALTRALDDGDAREATWVRADPVHLGVDANTVRLLTAGSLGLDREHSEQLRRSLAPLFGDHGLQLSTPHPERWYLRAERGTTLPALTAPWRVLGDDLRSHLPEGPDAPRWRRLLNEVQMVLHQHPVNLARTAAGQLAANSLWFWGAGTWPTRVSTAHDCVASDDPLLLALAAAAGISHGPALGAHSKGAAVLDLRAARDGAQLDRQWLVPAEKALRSGSIERLQVIFADGASTTLTRAAAFAFWRRAVE